MKPDRFCTNNLSVITGRSGAGTDNQFTYTGYNKANKTNLIDTNAVKYVNNR